MPVFEVTYISGDVEQIEADDCLDLGAHLTFVNYRVLLITWVRTEIVRRLSRRSVVSGREGER